MCEYPKSAHRAYVSSCLELLIVGIVGVVSRVSFETSNVLEECVLLLLIDPSLMPCILNRLLCHY